MHRPERCPFRPDTSSHDRFACLLIRVRFSKIRVRFFPICPYMYTILSVSLKSRSEDTCPFRPDITANVHLPIWVFRLDLCVQDNPGLRPPQNEARPTGSTATATAAQDVNDARTQTECRPSPRGRGSPLTGNAETTHAAHGDSGQPAKPSHPVARTGLPT